MKREIIILGIALLLILPLISADVNVGITQLSTNNAMIVDTNQPTMIDVQLTNNGGGDYFTFYSFFAGGMVHIDPVSLANGETKNVQLGFYPRADMKQRGFVNFDFFAKAQGGEQKGTLMVNVIELKDAMEVGSTEFDPSQNVISVYVRNLYNYNFDSIDGVFSSPFFNFEQKFSLAPNEIKEFNVTLNKDDFKKLMAGYYTMNADITYGGKTADIQGTIKFAEKNIVASTQSKFGFVINTFAVKKVNEGNVVSDTETVVQKNIISRVFTTFNTNPDTVQRQGLNVFYTWSKALTPGQTLDIVVTTNWLFPVLIVIFIVAIVALTRLYTRTNLMLKKRVSFVRAKGGEFALKVSVYAHARKLVEKVTVVDRLPPLVRLHERFGTEAPKRVDEKAKKLEWSFDRILAGETRVMSYIIYSKVGVVGRFALPKATGVYEREGVIHEAESNQAFFVAEQRAQKD
ncbi:MAG TPA: hypothetical protein VMC07_02350 [Candidatus Omnitrophota bacterium]|nr:hypothetical protein [Candidatus Omnitrophota bacterium]